MATPQQEFRSVAMIVEAGQKKSTPAYR